MADWSLAVAPGSCLPGPTPPQSPCCPGPPRRRSWQWRCNNRRCSSPPSLRQWQPARHPRRLSKRSQRGWPQTMDCGECATAIKETGARAKRSLPNHSSLPRPQRRGLLKVCPPRSGPPGQPAMFAHCPPVPETLTKAPGAFHRHSLPAVSFNRFYRPPRRKPVCCRLPLFHAARRTIEFSTLSADPSASSFAAHDHWQKLSTWMNCQAWQGETKTD
jgi:hypothetical protein